MKILIAIFCTILTSLSHLGADTFTINGKDINIPAPKGYVRVSDEMTELKKLIDIEQKIDTEFDVLAMYILETEIPATMAGKMPELKSWFMIKIDKELRNETMNQEDFSDFKNFFKTDLKDSSESMKAELAELSNN